MRRGRGGGAAGRPRRAGPPRRCGSRIRGCRQTWASPFLCGAEFVRSGGGRFDPSAWLVHYCTRFSASRHGGDLLTPSSCLVLGRGGPFGAPAPRPPERDGRGAGREEGGRGGGRNPAGRGGRGRRRVHPLQ